jgi:hypothetical protein
MEGNNPPTANWRIWIGDYERREWKGLIVRATVPVVEVGAPLPPTPPDGIDLPNTQSSAIVVGRLFIQVFSSANEALVRPQKMNPEMMPRIWPYQQSPIAWPPKMSLQDANAEAIATAIEKRTRNTPPARGQ